MVFGRLNASSITVASEAWSFLKYHFYYLIWVKFHWASGEEIYKEGQREALPPTPWPCLG